MKDKEKIVQHTLISGASQSVSQLSVFVQEAAFFCNNSSTNVLIASVGAARTVSCLTSSPVRPHSLSLLQQEKSVFISDGGTEAVR